MEIENFKKWLDLAHEYQKDYFWKQIFGDIGTSSPGKTETNPFSAFDEFFPKSDLYEAEGNVVAEIEIPGTKKEDVHISINQQQLTVTGEFKSLLPNRKYFLKERANRKFKKELNLPFPVQFDKIQSEIINGVLLIKLPFSQEEIENIPIVIDD